MLSSPATSANGNRVAAAAAASGNGGGGVAGVGGGSYGFMASSGGPPIMPIQGSPGSGGMPVVAPHDRGQEVCKYFINGGCLRGASCPYLHELPDERHLDVNGLGFILNPNVHNAQKTVAAPQTSLNPNPRSQSPKTTSSPLSLALGGQTVANRPYPFRGPKMPMSALNGSGATASVVMPPTKLQPPSKYIPPEPYLEQNLPPALAIPLKSAQKDVAQLLSQVVLQN